MRALGLVFVSTMLFAMPVLAQQGPPAVAVSMQVGDGVPVNWPLPNASPKGEAFNFRGGRAEGVWDLTWDLDFKTDPWIFGLISVANSSSLTQTYTFTINMPVSPTLPSPTLSGGSVGATLTDDGDGSASLAAVGAGSMYLGMIDGVGVLPLLPPPVASLTVASPGQSAVASANAMPPSLVTGAVSSTIGIQYRFTLSPHDIAAFTGRFEVIPEPATLLLLSLGGILLRRRSGRI